MLPQTNKLKYFYLIIISLGLLFVFFTNPFLKYPYDIFAHLIAIDELYHGSTTTTTSIQHGRLLWHDIWASIFHFLQIGSQELFLRAKIIHTIQLSLALFSIYFFSHVVLRNIFKKIDKIILCNLSIWSTLIWLTIFSTYSVYYHLVWSLWYSVNYQITLPLFFYSFGLTLVVLLEHISLRKKIFFSIQIILISLFILKIHSMEFMYYLMYIALFSLFYIDKFFYLFKKYYFIFISVILGFIYFIKTYQVETPKIFNYLNQEKFPFLYNKIISLGDKIILNLSRSESILNEFMYLIFYSSFIFFIFIFWKYHKNRTKINIRLLLTILGTSLFILIPQYQLSAGLFALISRGNVVHRIYFSSSLFILLPIFVYYVTHFYNLKLRYINLIFILLIVSISIFSKQNNVLDHNYYKNLLSIYASFDRSKLNFHLSQKNIETIGEKIHYYEMKNDSDKEIYYYARTDIAFVIKYLYHKNVFWKGRRKNPNYIKHYQKDLEPKNFQKVLFETPDMFPKYVPFW